MPAAAASHVPVGLRLREEEVDETWGAMVEAKLPAQGDATPAACTTMLRLLHEEELIGLASPVCARFRWWLEAWALTVHSSLQVPSDCRPHGHHCQLGPEGLQSTKHNAGHTGSTLYLASCEVLGT